MGNGDWGLGTGGRRKRVKTGEKVKGKREKVGFITFAFAPCPMTND